MQYFLKTCVYYSGNPEGLFRRNAGSVFSYEYAVNGTQAQSTEEIDLSGIRESERDFIKSAYREQIAPWIQNSILVDNELKAGIMAGRSDQKTQKNTPRQLLLPGCYCKRKRPFCSYFSGSITILQIFSPVSIISKARLISLKPSRSVTIRSRPRDIQLSSTKRTPSSKSC